VARTFRNPAIGVAAFVAAVACSLLPSAVAQGVLDPHEVAQVRAVWDNDRAGPGDRRVLAVVLNITPGYHINLDAAKLPASDVTLIPTELRVPVPPVGLRPGTVEYPAGVDVPVQYTGQTQPLRAFAGQAVLYVPVTVEPTAHAGTAAFKLSLSYQACNESVCLMPVTKPLQVQLQVMDQPVPLGKPAEPELFQGFTALPTIAAAGPPDAQATSVVHQDFFGWGFQVDTARATGITLLLLVALLAGVLLNFTPCVLPVVPLKVLSLHQQSGNPGRCLLLGLVFSGGIVAAFVLLGAMVAGLVVGLGRLEWGQIFSYWPVSVALGVVIALMGLGMFGMFTVRLPRQVYLFDASHETITGNFLLGILTAVLSTPCTGPMLGATIAWAIRQSAWLSLATFAVMGVGMALPYALLTANPKWINRLPRAGPASELLKQAMGLLLLAVAAFFFGPVIPGHAEWWLIAALVTVAMLWMVARTFIITSRSGVRATMVVCAALVTAGIFWLASMLATAGPIPWRPYSETAFDKALDDGKTLLLEFTADWCGNCKALELTTYRDSRLAHFFADDTAVAFQVDLTSMDNEPGWRKQQELGAGGGIPLAVVYRHGRPVAAFQGLFTATQLFSALTGP
jgi:thiol:disulfide interchange protein